MSNTKFDTLLIYKGKDPDSDSPVFDSIHVREDYDYNAPKPSIGRTIANKYLKAQPFDYVRFLDGKPCGIYALPEVLQKFGFNFDNGKKQTQSKKKTTTARVEETKAVQEETIESDFN